VKHYTALIAHADTGLSADDLVEEAQDGNPLVFHYDFEVPDGTDHELICLIGRGLFFQNDWTMDDTCSTIVEDLTVVNEIPDPEVAKVLAMWDEEKKAYEETRDYMDKRTENMNPPVCWNPNDPVNW
jgi:hypothetical protein